MRTLVVFLSMMALALLCATESYSQVDDFVCGTVWDENDPAQQIDLKQFGGIYLTAEVTIRMLVVYVSLPDHEEPHGFWPVLLLKGSGRIPLYHLLLYITVAGTV